MPKLYKQKFSENWYARVKLWDNEKSCYVRSRISTGTKDEESALAFAEAQEFASEQIKPFSGSRITREHAQNVLMTVLARAGIKVDGMQKSPLIKTFFADYLELKKNKVSAATFTTYKAQTAKFMLWLKKSNNLNQTMDWLIKDNLEKYYNWLLDHLAPKTSKDQVRYVSRVAETAVPKFLAVNPIKGIQFTTQKDSLKRLPLNMSEVQTILTYLENANTDRALEWSRAVMLAVSVGCRLEDAVQMKRSCLVGDLLTYSQLKTGKEIQAPIVKKDWLVCLSPVKDKYFCVSLAAEYERQRTATMSEEFTAIVVASGIDPVYHSFKASGQVVARKTFHSLRHTLRTSIVSSGGSDAQADLILGHSGNQGKTYTHSEADAMRAVLERVFNDS